MGLLVGTCTSFRSRCYHKSGNRTVILTNVMSVSCIERTVCTCGKKATLIEGMFSGAVVSSPPHPPPPPAKIYAALGTLPF